MRCINTAEGSLVGTWEKFCLIGHKTNAGGFDAAWGDTRLGRVSGSKKWWFRETGSAGKQA